MLRERRRHANFKPNRRLDRKSSRGMIYENEELRLRTININAEVERGQSDIRKLRRENEQLRREIWSLRDEYDRLNKLLRANRSTESCGGGGGCGGGENNGNNSGTQDEESDSCDTCKEDDGEDDIICDEIQCTIPNKNKCNSCEIGGSGSGTCGVVSSSCQDFHSHHQHQQSTSSSCGSDTKKKIPTSISSPSSLSNNGGSREITENYENSQKSQQTADSLSGNSSYRNCINCSCSSASSSNAVGGSGGVCICSKQSYIARQNSETYTRKSISSNIDNDNVASNATGINDDDDGDGGGGDKLRENLRVNFDHLSIVSEENLTNSDGNSIQQNDIELTSTSDAITKNKRLNRDSDIESLVPPLSHFENISYEETGPSLADLEDINYSRSTTSTGDTVIAANGWDFPTSLELSHPSTNNELILSINHNSNLPASEMATNTQSLSTSPFKMSQHFLDNKPSSPSLSLFSATDRSRSPRHFFSPLKPRLQTGDLPYSPPSLSSPSSLSINAFTQQLSKQQQHSHQNYNGPDVFVANALASSSSPYLSNTSNSPKKNYSNDVEPLYASVQKSSSKIANEKSSFQTGGNLEDLLMDIETLSKDIMQMQLKKQKSLSEDKLDNGGADTTDTGCLSNRKPFRSEMNLVLTYNGTNPVITPIMKSTTSTSLNCGFGMGCGSGIGGDGSGNGPDLDDGKDFSAATTMERGSVRETPPPPNVPEPMILFPENRPYLGFENFVHPPVGSLSNGKPVLSIFSKPIHQSKHQQSTSSDSPEISTLVSTDNKLPPSPHSPSDFNLNLDSEAPSVITTITALSSKPHLLDKKRNNLKEVKAGNFASETVNCDSSSGSESTIKRKSRRVSILFRKSEDKAAKKEIEKNQKEPKTEPSSTTMATTTTSSITSITTATATTVEASSNQPISTASVEGNVPGSPHSERHHSNSSLTSGHQHHHHHHGHHHHHHHHQGRKMSQDSGSTKYLPKLQPSSTANGQNSLSTFGQQQPQQQQSTSPSKNSNGRRHSEGTVVATISGGCGSDTSGGGAGIGAAIGGVTSSSHHHHHHHSHSHAGLVNSDRHHHHIRHDSYNDGGGGTSISERNSNSLASSRESSTSLSTRSHRRKISVSSHSGGKIPWCGCWGNGCL